MLRRLDLSSWGVVRQWVSWAAEQHACLPHILCCLAVASHPGSSLQVLARFLTCASVAGVGPILMCALPPILPLVAFGLCLWPPVLCCCAECLQGARLRLVVLLILSDL